MNRCPEPAEWVLYAAGEPSGTRLAVLRAHLGNCAACREELAAVSRGLAALGTLEREPAMSAGAETALRRRLAAAVARKTARPWIVALFSRHRWTAAAALVLWVALAAAFFAPARGTPHPWITDAQVVEEITAITAAVEMLEVGNVAVAQENGVNHKSPPADKTDDETEWLLQELSDELGVEG